MTNKKIKERIKTMDKNKEYVEIRVRDRGFFIIKADTIKIEREMLFCFFRSSQTCGFPVKEIESLQQKISI